MEIVEEMFSENGHTRILTDGEYYYVENEYGTQRVPDLETAESVAWG